MAVFVEAGRGRREGDPGKSISGAVRGTPGRRYRPVGGGKVNYTGDLLGYAVITYSKQIMNL